MIEHFVRRTSYGEARRVKGVLCTQSGTQSRTVRLGQALAVELEDKNSAAVESSQDEKWT